MTIEEGVDRIVLEQFLFRFATGCRHVRRCTIPGKTPLHDAVELATSFLKAQSATASVCSSSASSPSSGPYSYCKKLGHSYTTCLKHLRKEPREAPASESVPTPVPHSEHGSRVGPASAPPEVLCWHCKSPAMFGPSVLRYLLCPPHSFVVLLCLRALPIAVVLCRGSWWMIYV